MRAQAQSDPEVRSPGPAWRDSYPYVVTLCAFGAFSFLSGGYILTRAAPVALAWLAAAVAGVWIVRVRRRPSWLYLGALGALAAYSAWAGLSVLWSFGPDLSWTAFDYSAYYLAVAAILGVTTTGRRQLRLAGYGYLAVTVAVALYAFAGKVLPDVVTHAHTYARLDSPVGYWNVLALLMVMAIPVALSLAARRDAPLAVRAIGAAAAVPVAFTFVFSFSRGGVLAVLVVLVAYFALSERRLASFFSLVLTTGVVGAALWRVRGLDTLFSSTADDALRTAQGHELLRWALIAVVAAFGLQIALAALERAVRWPRALRIAAGALILTGILVGGGGGLLTYVDRQGGTEWLRERYEVFVEDADTRGTADTAGRLLSLNSGRPPLWRRALEQYDAGPKVGTGAGTYRFTHYRFRRNGGVTKHAHSQWLNALSELGLPGLLTFSAAMALFITASLRGLRRGRRDTERSLLAALQAGLIAFVVHMTWDWDWDMAAAGIAAVLFAAAAAAYVTTRDAGDLDETASSTEGAAGTAGEEHEAAAPLAGETVAPRPATGVAGRVLASGLLALLAVSWMPPYMGDRAQNRAVEEAARGEIAAAADSARSAHRWNPLAVDPLITLALLEQQLGENRAALETLRTAVALQPENYEVHYQLGLLLERAFDDRHGAAAAFRRTLQLNPLHDSARYELEALAGGG
jgi:hypothetical protein